MLFFEISNLLHRAWWQSIPIGDYLQYINPNLTYTISQYKERITLELNP